MEPTERQKQAGRDFAALKHKNNTLREKTVLTWLRANPNSTWAEISEGSGVSAGNLRSSFMQQDRSASPCRYSVNEQAIQKYLNG